DLEAHAILDATIFVESAPDRERAKSAAQKLREALGRAAWFKWDRGAAGYGLTPLEFAPTPASFCRSWFEDRLIERWLDHLAAEQQADGGWPITWSPPGPASELEWRGLFTVKALRTLRAYGRL
ncbi:MAG: hypothetical protein ACREEX_12090, partial [Caulobacteraceae bacterium]